MLTVLLFVAVLFKVSHVENLYFCSYLTFALVTRLTIAIRIGNATARSSAAFVEGKSKAKTLGIGIYWHCSLEARKRVSREAK